MYIIVKRNAVIYPLNFHAAAQPIVHNNIIDAKVEAHRLAEANPGVEFVIFQAVYGSTAKAVIELKNTNY